MITNIHCNRTDLHHDVQHGPRIRHRHLWFLGVKSMKLWKQHVKLNEIEDYYNYLYQCWKARYSQVKELQVEGKMLNVN